MSKKESEMFELNNLIKRATEITNSLFENSDHFRFKLRSESKQNDSTE